MARLETSSDDWYKFNEKADKIHRKYSDARTSDEKIKQRISLIIWEINMDLMIMLNVSLACITLIVSKKWYYKG